MYTYMYIYIYDMCIYIYTYITIHYIGIIKLCCNVLYYTALTLSTTTIYSYSNYKQLFAPTY